MIFCKCIKKRKNEKQNTTAFFDVQIICEEKEFTTSVYFESTFSEVDT